MASMRPLRQRGQRVGTGLTLVRKPQRGQARLINGGSTGTQRLAGLRHRGPVAAIRRFAGSGSAKSIGQQRRFLGHRD